METVACPLGGTDCTTAPCWEENGYAGHRCGAHRVIFISPRPNPDEMAALYDADSAGGASAAAHIAFSWQKRADARHALAWLRRLQPGGDLLEVGPGGGQFMLEARRAGYRPHAIELSAAQSRYLVEELHVPTHHGSAADRDAFPDASFDAVFHRDLLSHLHDPIGTFANLHRMLRPGGVMLFETGNGGDLSPRWLRWLGRLSYPEHLYLFGRGSVRAVLDRAGFECVGMRGYSIVPWYSAVKTVHRLRRRGAGTAPSEPAPVHDSGGDGRVKGTLLHALKYRISRGWPRRWPTTLHVAARAQA